MKKSLKNRNLRIGFIAILLTISGFFTSSFVNAGQLMPSVSDKVISYGQKLDGDLTYINTSQITEELTVEIFSYDPRESEVLANGKILMSTEITELIVEPGQEVVIPYQVNVTTELAKGSYFNVVALIDSSEKEGYTGGEIGKGNVKFNLRKGEGALFAFHVTDGGEVLSAQDVSVEYTSKRSWFMLPFFQVDPKIEITNNSSYPIKITGELRLFTQDGQLLATTRIEDVRLYPGESLVEKTDAKYWGIEDIKLVYSFGNNLGTDINSGSVTYANYTIYLLIGLVTVGIVIGAGLKIQQIRKRTLNSTKGIS